MGKSRIRHFRLKCNKDISNKEARSKANRKYRRLVKKEIHKGNSIFPKFREISNVWDFPSDGLAIYCKIEIYQTEKPYKYIGK